MSNNWQNIALPAFGNQFGTGLSNTFENINSNFEILKRLFDTFRLNPDNMYFLIIDLDWRVSTSNQLPLGGIGSGSDRENETSTYDLQNPYYQEFCKLVGISPDNSKSLQTYGAIIAYIHNSITNTAGLSTYNPSSGWGKIVVTASINESWNEGDPASCSQTVLTNSPINIAYAFPYIAYLEDNNIPVLAGTGYINNNTQTLTFDKSNNFPTISQNKHWVINGVETSISVKGADGTAGANVNVAYVDQIVSHTFNETSQYAKKDDSFYFDNLLDAQKNQACIVVSADNFASFYITKFEEVEVDNEPHLVLKCDAATKISPYWLYSYINQTTGADLDWSRESWHSGGILNTTDNTGNLIGAWLSDNTYPTTVFFGTLGFAWKAADWSTASPKYAYGYVFDTENTNWKCIKFTQSGGSWLVTNLNSTEAGMRIFDPVESSETLIYYAVEHTQSTPGTFIYQLTGASDNQPHLLSDLSTWTTGLTGSERQDESSMTHIKNVNMAPLELIWSYIFNKFLISTNGGDSFKNLYYDAETNKWKGGLSWRKMGMLSYGKFNLHLSGRFWSTGSYNDNAYPDNDTIPIDFNFEMEIGITKVHGWMKIILGSYLMPDRSGTNSWDFVHRLIYKPKTPLNQDDKYNGDPTPYLLPIVRIVGMDVIFEDRRSKINVALSSKNDDPLESIINTRQMFPDHYETPQILWVSNNNSDNLDNLKINMTLKASPNQWLKYYYVSKNAYVDEVLKTQTNSTGILTLSDINYGDTLFMWNDGAPDEELYTSTPLIYSANNYIISNVKELTFSTNEFSTLPADVHAKYINYIFSSDLRGTTKHWEFKEYEKVNEQWVEVTDSTRRVFGVPADNNLIFEGDLSDTTITVKVVCRAQVSSDDVWTNQQTHYAIVTLSTGNYYQTVRMSINPEISFDVTPDKLSFKITYDVNPNAGTKYHYTSPKVFNVNLSNGLPSGELSSATYTIYFSDEVDRFKITKINGDPNDGNQKPTMAAPLNLQGTITQITIEVDEGYEPFSSDSTNIMNIIVDHLIVGLNYGNTSITPQLVSIDAQFTKMDSSGSQQDPDVPSTDPIESPILLQRLNSSNNWVPITSDSISIKDYVANGPSNNGESFKVGFEDGKTINNDDKIKIRLEGLNPNMFDFKLSNYRAQAEEKIGDKAYKYITLTRDDINSPTFNQFSIIFNTKRGPVTQGDQYSVTIGYYISRAGGPWTALIGIKPSTITGTYVSVIGDIFPIF